MKRTPTLAVIGLALSIGLNADLRMCTSVVNESPVSELPVDQIKAILGTEVYESNNVLHFDIGREDLGNVQGPLDTTFNSSFQIHGDIHFQPLQEGRALLNGDMALLPAETNPFIDALLANGLVYQAFHQHLTTMEPQIWFVHFRGTGDPLELARKVRAAINTTAAPLPHTPPANQVTTLDTQRLATILNGNAHVGERGVVSVSVSRRHWVKIGEEMAKPEMGISTSIEFMPTGGTTGSTAAVVASFSLTATEVQPVVSLMRTTHGWLQGCLYNQETEESPQLYHARMLKTGDAYELAQEIRRGLDLTDSR